MKKLLILLLVIIGAALVLFLYSGDDHKELIRESALSGKDALEAEKFTEYIHTYAKKYSVSKFQKRFRYIPPENLKHVWDLLRSIQKLGKSEKVMVPATGKTRRCVYYHNGADKYLKFVVNNSDKKWFFLDLALVNKD